VATPRRIELHHPVLLACLDLLGKRGGGQIDNLLDVGVKATATAWRSLWSRLWLTLSFRSSGGILSQSLGVPGSAVWDWSLALWSKVLDCWEALDVVLRAHGLVGGVVAVHRTKVHLTLGLLCGGDPSWLQVLAVATPRRIELHHPVLLACLDLLGKRGGGQINNLLDVGVKATSASACTRGGRFLLVFFELPLLLHSKPEVDGSLGTFQGEGGYLLCSSLSLVAFFKVHLSVRDGDGLDGGQTLNAILRSGLLVRVDVDCRDGDDAVETFGHFLPLGLQVFAVAAPRGEEFDQVHPVLLQLLFDCLVVQNFHWRSFGIQSLAGGREANSEVEHHQCSS